MSGRSPPGPAARSRYGDPPARPSPPRLQGCCPPFPAAPGGTAPAPRSDVRARRRAAAGAGAVGRRQQERWHRDCDPAPPGGGPCAAPPLNNRFPSAAIASPRGERRPGLGPPLGGWRGSAPARPRSSLCPPALPPFAGRRRAGDRPNRPGPPGAADPSPSPWVRGRPRGAQRARAAGETPASPSRSGRAAHPPPLPPSPGSRGGDGPTPPAPRQTPPAPRPGPALDNRRLRGQLKEGQQDPKGLGQALRSLAPSLPSSSGLHQQMFIPQRLEEKRLDDDAGARRRG